MTPIQCMDPAEIATLAEAPAGDPRRAHADECPRCGALLAEYRRFLSMSDPAVGADLDAADAALTAALAREMGVRAAPAAGASRVPAPARRDARAPSWLEWLGAPALRPAFAALVLLAAGALVWPMLRRPAAPLMRGGEARAVVAIERVEPVADGLALRWHGVPGADAYELRFYASSLAEIGRVAVGADTARVIPATALPGAGGAAGPHIVRVVALAGGDVVATSAPQPFDAR